jgi:hypothetical protein
MNRTSTDASVRSLFIGLFIAAIASPVAADDDQWGTVRFRIRCPDVAAKNLPADGSLEVDLKTGALANAMIWVRGEITRVHPAYGVSDTDQITLQFGNDRIRPRAIVARKSQTLGFTAVDGQSHAPVFMLGPCGLLPPTLVQTIPLTTSKILPQQLTCAIHPAEIAYVKILDHPYGDATDPDGTAEIRDLPAGVHELQFWHERAGYLNLWKPEQDAPATAKGRIKITVNPGLNDLGEFIVPRAEFK